MQPSVSIMTSTLILYATSHGHTRVVAQAIAEHLRHRGAHVQMANLNELPPPSPVGFDSVVLGSRVHFSKLDSELVAYVRRYKRVLDAKPSYLFSVGMAAQGPHAHESELALEKWCSKHDWKPRAIAAFAGALMYRAYNPFMRTLMKFLSRHAGHTTDTSRDYISTDWTAVGAFADRVSGVEVASVPAAV